MKTLGFIVSLIFTVCAQAQQPDTLLHKTPAPPVGAQSGAQLGFSVAMDGGLTIVGAPLDDTGASNSGVVKVFDTASGALLHLLTNPSPSGEDRFGTAVAISGARVVIGAPGDNTGATMAGSVYVYDLAGMMPTVPVNTLNNPEPFFNDKFGTAVAITGMRVVVGAQFNDAGGTDAGSAYVYDLAGGTPTVPIFILNNPTPQVSDEFGNAVAISGGRVAVGAYRDRQGSGSAERGAVYAYDLEGGTPTTPQSLPGVTLSGQFGFAVALAGTTLAVGTPKDDSPPPKGSVTLHDLTGKNLPQKLTNPDPTPGGDDFGFSVAIAGTNLIVGAPKNDSGASDAGTVYIYTIGSPTPSATLDNPAPGAGDAFGWAVACSGPNIVAAAFLDDTAAMDAGAAYVYEAGNTTPTATLNTPSPSANDEFGNAVAVSGTRLIVGAMLDDTGATDAGSAYVYDLASTTPTIPAFILNNPDPAADDRFGFSVAISGTLAVVGAPQDDAGASNAGRVYLYELVGGVAAIPLGVLVNPDPAADDRFGQAVDIAGMRVVIGAPQDDAAAANGGTVYVYDLTSPMPLNPILTLNKPGAATSDNFGSSVAISDGLVAVGVPFDNTGASLAGSAHVFDLDSGTPTVPVATLNNPGPASNDRFGNAIAISGRRIVVGAALNDVPMADSGSAYVYDLDSPTPTTPAATINNPAPAFFDEFGGAVAISGTRVVIGAARDDTGASEAGSAYVYDLNSGTPTAPVATLNNPDLPGGAALDFFGYSVALDGLTAAVGTPFDDTPVAEKGSVSVYRPANRDRDGDGLLDLWEEAVFGTIVGHSALDDSDGDGVPELLELAFALDPLTPDSAAIPPIVNEAGFLTVTLAKRAGVIYSAESADALFPAAFSAATTTLLIDNATMLKARDNVPIVTVPARFMHLRVTAAP